MAEDFFETTPEWSAPVPEGAVVALAGEHVVWYDPTGSIGVLDSSGAEVWSEEVEPFGYVEDGDIGARIRVVDERTVALVQVGRTDPEPPNDPQSVYRAWLYDVASGRVGEPVDASPTDGFHMSDHGLAFFALDGENQPSPRFGSITVSAAGEVTEHEPTEDTLAGTPVHQTPHMTVGDTPVLYIQGEWEPYTTDPVEGDFDRGFGGEGWNSMDVAPSSAPDDGEDAAVVAVVGDRLIARWHETGGDGSNDVFALMDPVSGELVSELSCSGEDFCTEAGGPVEFRSVDGEGRWFGDIGDIGAEVEDGEVEVDTEVVMVGVDGEAVTAPIEAGAHAPIGFLEGDLAVHHDRDSGLVTANRLKI